MTYGIITHYKVHNHGALLQLYALKRVLEAQGISAFALKYERNYDFLEQKLKYKYVFSIKSVSAYYRYLREKGVRCFLYNWGKRRCLYYFRTSEHILGRHFTEYQNLDAVVIGSDEVFSLDTGMTPVLFGYAAPSDKVFSYAGSFGPTTIGDIDSLHCREFVKDGLSSLKGLGMRDVNSAKIAEELTGNQVELVCDPVILYGFANEIQNSVIQCPDHYLVVYAYDNRLNAPEEYEPIIVYARSRGLRIVSPGFFHKWVDENINCTPVELLAWFKNADCVITDTFHGCVMSIITNRPLAAKIRRDNANKVDSLLSEYNLSDRIISEDWSNIQAVFGGAIDWDEVNSQLSLRRESSMAYLKRMIAL